MIDRYVRRVMSGLILGLPMAVFGLPSVSVAQTVPEAQLSALDYRYIGPVGNRIASVAGVVGDRETYYVGAASGGAWKTEDAGVTWRPIFDDQDVHAIGALAPCQPRIRTWCGPEPESPISARM